MEERLWYPGIGLDNLRPEIIRNIEFKVRGPLTCVSLEASDALRAVLKNAMMLGEMLGAQTLEEDEAMHLQVGSRRRAFVKACQVLLETDRFAPALAGELAWFPKIISDMSV